MDLISIIVPVYNVEKYIHECVDSIINQTYKNIEIILVDDGSPDNCGKICDEYAETDNRIRVIHKENGGLSDARNHGIESASGDWLMFIDSDDWIDSSMAEKLLTAAKENNAEIAVGNIYLSDPDKGIDEKLDWGYNQSFVTTGTDILKASDENNGIPSRYTSACYKLTRKDLYSEIRFPVGRIYEDVSTVHHILYKCKRIASIPDCLYHYRNVSGSITRRDCDISLFDVFYAYKDRFDFYNSHGLEAYTSSLQDSFYAYIISDYYKYSSDKANRKKLREYRGIGLHFFPRYFRRKDIAFNQKLSVLLFCLFPDAFRIIFRR